MRGVLQRVSRARVLVDGAVIAAIGEGLLLLLGVANDDQPADAERLIDKILNLRIFANDAGKFDRSLLETGGQLLVVSQFTLFADTRKGRRPAFTEAARPEQAIPLYELLVARSRAAGVDTATGRFGADMQVELSNDGPVTILVDSKTV